MLTFITRWFMRRQPTPEPQVRSLCPACYGALIECSTCEGNWLTSRCIKCRLGKICTSCNLSWVYYLQSEGTSR